MENKNLEEYITRIETEVEKRMRENLNLQKKFQQMSKKGNFKFQEESYYQSGRYQEGRVYINDTEIYDPYLACYDFIKKKGWEKFYFKHERRH